MKKTLTRVAIASAAFLPVVAFAQDSLGTDANFGRIGQSVQNVVGFINGVLIPAIFAIALLMFIWGMYRFFIGNGEVEKAKGKDLAIYAVVGFVLMVSIWGIVNVVASGLGLTNKDIDSLIPSGPTTDSN